MGLLDRITGPRDLRDLTDDQLDGLAAEIRDRLVAHVLAARRAPRPQPRRRRADHGASTGSSTRRRDRVVFDTGHQAYVHKMLTGARRRVRHAAPGGRPVRLPEPGRVRARHRRELPRLDRAVLRRRPGQGLRDPRRGPLRRRGHRRRRAHRRHGLGGAEQHRRRPGPQARHRRQRQRPLLHPDRRRPRQPPDHAAHQPPLRAGPRPGQEAAQRRPRRRPRRLRRAARGQEGHEGRARARRACSRTSA